MKIAVLFSFLFLSTLSFGQIDLEHTYNDGVVTRIKLEYSGEKYYLFKSATNELVFYNNDHSLWKTIILPAPAPTQYTHTLIFHVSEGVFNSDSNLEIIFGFFNGSLPGYQAKVMAEDGTIIGSLDNVYSVAMSDLPNLPLKLIGTSYNPESSKVYSVPELSLEHVYTEGQVSRVALENSGEKYYVADKVNGVEKVYNSDHTIWKTIALPKPADAFYSGNAAFISETAINSDNLLEIGYNYYTVVNSVYTYVGKIINENNTALLTVPEASSMYISVLEGCENKLMVRLWDNANNITSNVYQLPSLVLEHTYESEVARIKLENSGEKYYTSSYPLNHQAKVYNNDHSIWKTITLPIPPDYYQITGIGNLSESKINADPLLELSYTYFTAALEIAYFETQIINENGVNYLTIEGANSVYISELTDLANKLIATIQVSSFDSVHYYGKVYSLAPLATTSFEKGIHAVVAPNPTSSFLTITCKDSINEATLYNMTGERVKEFANQDLRKINVENLPTGIYLLKLTDNNNQKSTHKITITH